MSVRTARPARLVTVTVLAAVAAVGQIPSSQPELARLQEQIEQQQRQIEALRARLDGQAALIRALQAGHTDE